jgi:multidrug efflux pump subunit AcrB
VIVSDTAVRQRVSVLVLALIAVIFGIYCYSVLPRESEPDITIPHVFVSTSYKGVSSSDIETSITVQIEKKLKGMEGIKKISSVSSEGLSSINIEFLTGTDIDDALQKVRNKVDEAKNDLPSDLENDPSVFEVNFSELPIVVFSISGPCGLTCLKKIADDLEEEFESIPGVLDVEVTGGLEREIRIEVSPEKLAFYGIPITAFERVVSSENQNTSGGSISLGDGRFQLRVPGEFNTPDELFGLVVGTHEGQPVYLKDLAEVIDGFKDETSRSRLNGQQAVSMAVKKRAGENIISITDKIDEIISLREPLWPKGTRITKMMDKAKDIRQMVADLENNILSGLMLVVVVLFFFLGFRNAIIVSLAIPFSMLISFIVLYALGITLNMVVLFSLTLALGMLVDNAIVIVENIYRYMQQGVPRLEAAMRATSEVAMPVICSTITTLAAFSPLLFWPGIMGEFMGYLPLTLIITLSSSLFVAMVINPAIASIFMRVSGEVMEKQTPEDVAAAGEKPIDIKGPFLPLYERLLRSALKHRLLVVFASFGTLVLLIQTWLLLVGLEKPVEFFPDIEPKSMYININTPAGADIDYSDRVVRQVEMRVNGMSGDRLEDPSLTIAQLYEESHSPKTHVKATGAEFAGPSDLVNVEYVYSKAVASTGGGMVFSPTTPNHVGVQFIDLEERVRPSYETLDGIRERLKGIAGGTIVVAETSEGPPTGAPINIEISGDDFRVLGEMAGKIKEFVERVPNVKDVNDDYVEGTPSVRVKVDRQKAALFGLRTSDIGFALKTGYKGLEVSTYREGNEDYDITVQLSDSNRRVTDVLKELMIPTYTGHLVPLTTLAKIDYSGGIGDIIRIDHKRVVSVKANVDETKVPGPVARAGAEDMLEKFPVPPGYDIEFTGEFEFQKESEEFLSKAFVTALLFIFLILVTQFNSVTQPFIIMTSVVLSLGGAFLGLSVIRSPFGIIMTGVGVISLAGVVVNNAIVLIDYINKLIKRGLPLKEAVVAAGATRLRPVMLTAITTILGLLPMVTGVSYDFHKWSISWLSESSQWWRTMAIVVIFGLMTATFLTLVVVPVLYSLFHSLQRNTGLFVSWTRRLYWKPYTWLTGDTDVPGATAENRE